MSPKTLLQAALWRMKKQCFFVEERQRREPECGVYQGMPVSDGEDWDFGGLATKRHKQPVSPVAVFRSFPLCRSRYDRYDRYDRPSARAAPGVGLLGDDSRDDHGPDDEHQRMWPREQISMQIV